METLDESELVIKYDHYSISLNKYCISLLGPLISFCIVLLCIVLLCLYICMIRATFSGSFSCKESNMCLSETCLFVKSTTCCFSSVVNLPTMELSSNLSGTSYINLSSRPIVRRSRPDFERTSTYLGDTLCFTIYILVFPTFITVKYYVVASPPLACFGI